MSVLHPTPPDRMVDAQGRPYFLWDTDMTLAEFNERLRDPDPIVRAHFLAKLMRQARPDDVLTMVGTRAIRAAWSGVEYQLGHTREFWAWWIAVSGSETERDASAR